MKKLDAYGNAKKTNLLFDEFLKGRQQNLSKDEEIIINEVKENIEMEKGNSFIERSRQKCKNLFISVNFRGMKLIWYQIDETTLGPIYYPTDFGSCCLLVPHLDLKPKNENQTTEEMYHYLKVLKFLVCKKNFARSQIFFEICSKCRIVWVFEPWGTFFLNRFLTSDCHIKNT